ncbi:dienelactone hydrolase family protein [Candidatus Acetothermia bacterium]|nr:dienelactone hydrolase family protein [Candidatus Acetothermia bacterium]
MFVNDLQKYLVEEYLEHYQEGQINRREALHQITLILGSAALADRLMAEHEAKAAPSKPSIFSPKPTPAQTQPGVTVPPDDPDIQVADVKIPAQGFTLFGYLATPKKNLPAPGILVDHENRGLVEHIKDVARRAAKAGYVALAPDLASRAGGTQSFANPADVTGVLGQITPDQIVSDLSLALDYLRKLPEVQAEKLGATGFCYGGGTTWRIVTKRADLRAVVPFYGPNPPIEDVKNIKAACLGIYAGNDTRINSGIPALEAAFKAANVTYEIMIYPNVNHAFHNDTGQSYNEAAAKDAWAKALAWFQKYLRE